MSYKTAKQLIESLRAAAVLVNNYGVNGEELVSLSINFRGDVELHINADCFLRLPLTDYDESYSVLGNLHLRGPLDGATIVAVVEPEKIPAFREALASRDTPLPVEAT